MSVGYVNIIAFFIMFPMTMIFAPIDVKIAHLINQRMLKIIFGIFLMMTLTKMLISIFL